MLLSELINKAKDDLSKYGDMEVEGYCEWQNAFFVIAEAKKIDWQAPISKEVLSHKFIITDAK